MRYIAALLLSAFLAPASLVVAQAPSRWAVASSTKLDPRIQSELRTFAAHSHAQLIFSRSTSAPATSSLRITFQLDATPEALAAAFQQNSAALPAESAQQAYILRANYLPSSQLAEVRIEARTAEGQHHALLRLPSLLAQSPSTLAANLIPAPQSIHVASDNSQVIIADYPALPIRGVVEGFYGTPWSHQDRLEVLRFEGRHAMNVYYYGPKDDLYHRERWRDPYPAKQQAQLAALIRAANQNFVHFNFAVSPGLSITYSSEKDFQTLSRKYASIAKLGVTDFSLFLDDVPEEVAHDQDRRQFSTLAAAHIYLANKLNRFLQSLSPRNRLMLCPTTYTNEWGSRDYIRELGAGVSPDIDIAWTGPEVISSTITAEQAREWAGFLHRKPLVWDNFFSNDERPWLLSLQPLSGRDSVLAAEVHGLVQNPMNQARASMLMLETSADYSWNPAAYSPAQSRAHSAAEQYGPAAAQTLAPLFALYDKGGAALTLFPSAFDLTPAPIDTVAIESTAARLDATVQTLQSQPQFRALAAEIAPIPAAVRDQLKQIQSNAHYTKLPSGRLQWNYAIDALAAQKLPPSSTACPPQSASAYSLDKPEQLSDGTKLWTGPQQFSLRVSPAWDESNLYISVEITNPTVYAPFTGRGAAKQDAFRLILDTDPLASMRADRTAGIYDLYFSPGDFALVPPTIYRNREFFPLGDQPDTLTAQIRAEWKKTSTGAAACITIPAALFGDKFAAGRQIPLSFAAQKVFPRGNPITDDPDAIVFTSRPDALFPVGNDNPFTLQRLTLMP